MAAGGVALLHSHSADRTRFTRARFNLPVFVDCVAIPATVLGVPLFSRFSPASSRVRCLIGFRSFTPVCFEDSAAEDCAGGRRFAPPPGAGRDGFSSGAGELTVTVGAATTRLLPL